MSINAGSSPAEIEDGIARIQQVIPNSQGSSADPASDAALSLGEPTSPAQTSGVSAQKAVEAAAPQIVVVPGQSKSAFALSPLHFGLLAVGLFLVLKKERVI